MSLSVINKSEDIYDPGFVSGMFDRMSKTYGFANYITSFGFTARWRRQCLQDLPFIKRDAIGYDLMSGMGEAWGDIHKKSGQVKKLYAVDISEEMNRRASQQLQRLKQKNIELLQADVLNQTIASNSADFVVSTFGLKTFNSAQQKILAAEIDRILKPGGTFALIEISEPKPLLLKWLFMFYLKLIIPFIGKVFLGNSEDYRMLGKYCASFKSCREFHAYLKGKRMDVTFKQYFMGCATGVYGMKYSE